MKQDIRTIRQQKNPYVVMDKKFSQKSNLSRQAKDLLVYLLVHSGNCAICRKELAKRLKCDKKAIAKILKELAEHLCCKDKSATMKIAILTEEPHEHNGFYTKLLEINQQDFRIEKHGIRHSSGTFFKLDRSSFKAAKQFLNEVCYE